MNLISVIIPVYNSEKYLDRCLGSVLGNTYRELEVILVDDGSADSSGAICDSYARKDDRVKVIHKQNAGTAAARNTALDIASGRYIAFADNDDFIHPKFYELMIGAIQSTDADIVVCELTRDAPENEFINADYSQEACVGLVDKHSFILGTYTDNWTRNTAPWNKLYKRELFEEIRFPDGKGYEDAYTTYRLIYKAKKIALLNAYLYYWFENKESYSGKKDNPKKLLFREEALRLQSKFYNTREYRDIKKASQGLYLYQLFFMYYQLYTVYEKSDDLALCLKYFRRRLWKYYYLHFRLLDSRTSFLVFEILHPIIGGILRKFKKQVSK